MCILLSLSKKDWQFTDTCTLLSMGVNYGSLLHSVNQINAIENIQRKFTKHITGMHSLSYENRLKCLNLYSLQRRRDRYTAIYVWKIMEEIVSNLLQGSY